MPKEIEPSQALPSYPASERNKQPIAEVLAEYLPNQGRVLEVASGTGQHIVYFAEQFPGLVWLPSDADSRLLDVIRARLSQYSLVNIEEPIELDVLGSWPALTADALVVANLLHIAPIAVTNALFEGAYSVLSKAGFIHLYGPFRVDGEHTSEGNISFDADLQARDPDWGIRDLEFVVAQARDQGFSLRDKVAMPANNFSLLFVKD